MHIRRVKERSAREEQQQHRHYFFWYIFILSNCFIFVLEVVKVCEHKLLFDAATIIHGAFSNITVDDKDFLLQVNNNQFSLFFLNKIIKILNTF
jgi:hypothetical protein